LLAFRWQCVRGVLRIRAIQMYIYLLTYLLTYLQAAWTTAAPKHNIVHSFKKKLKAHFYGQAFLAE